MAMNSQEVCLKSLLGGNPPARSCSVHPLTQGPRAPRRALLAAPSRSQRQTLSHHRQVSGT